MKPAKDLPAAFRREITLDIGDQQDQHTQQHHNLDGIIQEEPDTASDTVSRIQSDKRQQRTNPAVQPLHSQYFVLNKIPDHEQQHPPFSSLEHVQRMDSI